MPSRPWLCASLAAVIILPPSATVAQQVNVPFEPTFSLTRQQASTFQSAFTALANKTHLTFVAEGQPLKTTLDPNTPLDLKEGGEPLFVLVAKVAAAYDYDAGRQGNIVLLKKRFTDPADLPDVTLAECAAAVKDVLSITDALNPHLKSGAIEDTPSIRTFLQSFTPEQLKAMADEQQGMALTALSPQQQRGVQQIMNYMYVQQPVDILQPLADQLDRATKHDPHFCWRDLPGMGAFPGFPHLFGFTLPTGQGRRERYTALGRPAEVSPNPGGGMSVSYDPLQQTPVGLSPDPTDPPKKAKPQPKEADLSLTLSQIIAALNARRGIGPQMLVDAALAPKHASVFNADAAPPATLLQAVADLYGLRVRTLEDGTQVLSRRARRLTLNYRELAALVQQALPDPMLRASETIGKGKPSPLRVAAVKALRAAAEPKMEKDFNKQVALSELSDRENMALADAMMADVMSQLNLAFGPTLPPLAARYSEARINGGSYKDKESGGGRFAFSLCLPGEDLNHKKFLKPQISIGNMFYDSPAP